MPKKCNTVAVVDRNGIPLMPTNSARARILKDRGRAETYCHAPIYTIRMLDVDSGDVQPMELKVDTGYEHIGISVCSEKHEYLRRQYDLLDNETEKHNDRRKYRRARRNRLRYRKPRFSNRKGLIAEDGFAPSVRNRRDRHIDLIRDMAKVMPVSTIWLEMGNFDTQVLRAIEEGRPLPEGTDYQHGERYGSETLRMAVFTRDNYTCVICGRNAFRDNAILHEHHVGFWKGDRTDRMANLATVCERCHTPANHKEGGKLYGMEPKFRTLKEATFMTMVRWDMYRRVKEMLPDADVRITYGAATKLAREDLSLPKSHDNDAYSMGRFHPKHRAAFERFKKRRRNDRVLEKFYDAVYTDTRNGSGKKGSQLGCNRTKRSIPRDNPGSLRQCRGHKVSKGHRSVRRQRYEIRPGDTVLYAGRKYKVRGIQDKGTAVSLCTTKEVPAADIKLVPDRSGAIRPPQAGRKYALTGRKEKHLLLSTDGVTAVFEWYFAVKPEAITVVSAKQRGWIPA